MEEASYVLSDIVDELRVTPASEGEVWGTVTWEHGNLGSHPSGNN
jgi:hypothetical protein